MAVTTGGSITGSTGGSTDGSTTSSTTFSEGSSATRAGLSTEGSTVTNAATERLTACPPISIGATYETGSPSRPEDETSPAPIKRKSRPLVSGIAAETKSAGAFCGTVPVVRFALPSGVADASSWVSFDALAVVDKGVAARLATSSARGAGGVSSGAAPTLGFSSVACWTLGLSASATAPTAAMFNPARAADVRSERPDLPPLEGPRLLTLAISAPALLSDEKVRTCMPSARSI
ncbi:hypothetical protein D3C80_577110 [compost metagenome]